MKSLIPGLLFLCAAHLASGQASNYPNGSTVADFTVTDTQGQTHNLYTYTAQGKYVILDFFFTTCPPCQATQPYFSELHETYGCNGGDLVVLSINQGMDDDADVIAYEIAYGGSFAHAPAASMEGGGGAVTSDFGVGAFPTYCLIGPDNKMKQNDIWPVSSMQSYVNAFPANSGISAMACATAISEVAAAHSFSVVPTVTDRYVTVEANGTREANLDLHIFDLTGRDVLSTKLDAGASHTLDLGHLPNGQYFIKLISNGMLDDTRRIAIAR